METYPSAFLFIAFVIMLAPLIIELTRWFQVPVLVFEVLLGILIGPHMLNLADPGGIIGALANLGFVFLLFMVGLDIDFEKIRGRPLKLAINGWLLSFITALGGMVLLNAMGFVQTPVLITAAAISTTALAILTPILRDRGELDSQFGVYLMAAATVGEFGPLTVISFFLIPEHNSILHTFLVVVFVGLAYLAAYITLNARSLPLISMLQKTMLSSGQLPVRICILLQILFVALAVKIGLSMVVGAFTAGIIVGMSIKGPAGELLKHKLDAIGYGFLIPIFFISVGMKFELNALWSNPLAPVQIIFLLGLILLIRGVPVILYKDILTGQEQSQFVLYSATTLPLIIAISEIGVSTGAMTSDWATMMVCAGMFSVILFPVLTARMVNAPEESASD